MKYLKQIVFVVSIVGATMVLSTIGIAHTEWENILVKELDYIFFLLIVFAPTFLFSLITYFLPEKVFLSWYRFAVWWVPLIMLVTYYFLSHPSNGGFADPRLDIGIPVLLHIIYIIVSIVKITRARGGGFRV